MPTLCSAAVKEIVNQTLSDVIIDGVAGDFACLPSERTKLFAVPNGISLCSSEFIQGVLLGAGAADASFIAYSIRVPILVTSVAPYLVASDTGVDNFVLGINPTDMAAVMLLAQLLIAQMQISFLVQRRVQVCEFASQFPAGGGMWAALSNVSQICPQTASTECSVAGQCSPPLFVGTFNNGTPEHDNRFELTQPVGIGTGMSLGATIAFDNVANSNGECISVLDLLAQAGNTAGCASTLDCPTGPTFQAAGILVKADFAIDGLLCHAIC